MADDDARETPTRRRVLGVAVGAGALGVLAACGGDGSPPAATTSPTGSSEPAGTEAASGEVLVAAAEVPVGAGVILDKQRIVVTQPSEGTFKAFTAVCTHQGCTVGTVKDGTISCPCHGSTYDASNGEVTNGPATRALREIPVALEGSDVVRA